jgi:hypothetical protein
MMPGAGPILWRAIVEKCYPGRGLGTSPPFSRAVVAAWGSDFKRMPASRKYYEAIDKLTASSIS